MKKKVMVWVAVAAIALTGCGNAMWSSDTASSSYEINESWDAGFNSYETSSSAAAADTDSVQDYTTSEDYDYSESDYTESDYTGSDSISDYKQKLIRTYTYNFETLEFDESIAYVNQKVSEYGGYIESSETSGSTNRYAYLTIRIPVEKSEAFLNEAGEIGEITYKSSSSEDVTTNYYDTEARLTSLQTQHERLLELLAQAQSLDDIVALNSQLANVEYEIDRYTTMMRVYDNKIDYVTIEFSIREVQQIQATADDSFWTQIKKGLSSNTSDVINGLMNFAIFLLTGIPYFVILAIVIAILVFIIRKIRKSAAKKREKRECPKHNENPDGNDGTERE
jgi:large-conductance mechanosensitive channel